MPNVVEKKKTKKMAKKIILLTVENARHTEVKKNE